MSNASDEVDLVNHPPHYTFGKIEVIDVIDGLDLDYYQGTIVKYLARWKHKGGVQDLKKAEWYLKRYIANVEAQVSE
jgi:hypothetical protein